MPENYQRKGAAKVALQAASGTEIHQKVGIKAGIEAGIKRPKRPKTTPKECQHVTVKK
jgi:hypothetical protein